MLKRIALPILILSVSLSAHSEEPIVFPLKSPIDIPVKSPVGIYTTITKVDPLPFRPLEDRSIAAGEKFVSVGLNGQSIIKAGRIMGKLEVTAHSISFELDNPKENDESVNRLHRLTIVLPLAKNEDSDLVAKRIEGAKGEIHVSYDVKAVDVNSKAPATNAHSKVVVPSMGSCSVGKETLSFDCHAQELNPLGLNVRLLWMTLPGSPASKVSVEKSARLTPIDQLLEKMNPTEKMIASPSLIQQPINLPKLPADMIQIRKIDPEMVKKLVESYIRKE